MQFKKHSLRVVSNSEFQTTRDTNILVYLPNGFGDWVFFSYILPLLDPSNKYWVTRYGDDTVAVMSDNYYCRPIYLGIKTPHCSDGEDFGHRHFDVDYNLPDGSEQCLSLPAPLYTICREKAIDTLLVTPFFEICGSNPFPFHTKARSLLKDLSAPERLSSMNLTAPLSSCINFETTGCIAQWVEARLRSFTGFGESKLCIVGRTGYSSTGKNWGHQWRGEEEDGVRLPEGEECREFMRLMLKRDRNWIFLSMEDRMFHGDETVASPEWNCYSYAELFGMPDGLGLPYGIVMKALINLADLSIGVPAGAHHLCMSKQELPSIGLWIEHHPSWYEEPKQASLHLISSNVKESDDRRQVGSFVRTGSYAYNTLQLNTRRIYGEQVLNAVEQLLGS